MPFVDIVSSVTFVETASARAELISVGAEWPAAAAAAAVVSLAASSSFSRMLEMTQGSKSRLHLLWVMTKNPPVHS